MESINSSEFVTLEKTDQKIKTYLSGEFSRKKIALPVPRSDLASQHQVTFQLVEKSEIQNPGLVKTLFCLFRVELLPLTVLPVLSMVYMHYSAGSILNFQKLMLLLSGLLFTHAGVFSLNDYYDHMSGVDSLSEKGGSRVIQNGWMPAKEVFKWSALFLSLGTLCGLPLIVTHPQVSVFVLGGGVLGVLGYAHSRFGLKFLGFGDMSVFLCLGPLLMAGSSLALLGWVSSESILLGALYGLLAVIYVQVRQLSSIMVDHLSGVKSLAVRLGFDRAKIFIGLEVLFFLVVFSASLAFIFDRGWTDVLAAPVYFWAIYLSYVLFKMRSPVASAMTTLNQKALLLQMMVILSLLVLSFFGRVSG